MPSDLRALPNRAALTPTQARMRDDSIPAQVPWIHVPPAGEPGGRIEARLGHSISVTDLKQQPMARGLVGAVLEGSTESSNELGAVS